MVNLEDAQWCHRRASSKHARDIYDAEVAVAIGWAEQHAIECVRLESVRQAANNLSSVSFYFILLLKLY